MLQPQINAAGPSRSTPLQFAAADPHRYVPTPTRSLSHGARTQQQQEEEEDTDTASDYDTQSRRRSMKRVKTEKSTATGSSRSSMGKENIPPSLRRASSSGSRATPSSSTPRRGASSQSSSKKTSGKKSALSGGQTTITAYWTTKSATSNPAPSQVSQRSTTANSETSSSVASAVMRARPVPPRRSASPSKPAQCQLSGAAPSKQPAQMASSAAKGKARAPPARDPSSDSDPTQPETETETETEDDTEPEPEPPETLWETPPPATWQRNAQSRQHIYRMVNGVPPREGDDVYTQVPGRPGEKKIRSLDRQLNYDALKSRQTRDKENAERVAAEAYRRLNNDEVRPFQTRRGMFPLRKDKNAQGSAETSEEAPKEASKGLRSSTPSGVPARSRPETQSTSAFDDIPPEFHPKVADDKKLKQRLDTLFSKSDQPNRGEPSGPAPQAKKQSTKESSFSISDEEEDEDEPVRAAPADRLPAAVKKEILSQAASPTESIPEDAAPPSTHRQRCTVLEEEPAKLHESALEQEHDVDLSEPEPPVAPHKGVPPRSSPPTTNTMPYGQKTQISESLLMDLPSPPTKKGEHEPRDDAAHRVEDLSSPLSAPSGFIQSVDIKDGFQSRSPTSGQEVLALDTQMSPGRSEEMVAAGSRKSARFERLPTTVPEEDERHGDDPDRTLVAVTSFSSPTKGKARQQRKKLESDASQLQLSGYAQFKAIAAQDGERREKKEEDARRRQRLQYREDEESLQKGDRWEGRQAYVSDDSDDDADKTKVELGNGDRHSGRAPSADSGGASPGDIGLLSRLKPRKTLPTPSLLRIEHTESQPAVYVDLTETQRVPFDNAAIAQSRGLAEDDGAEETQPLPESQTSGEDGGYPSSASGSADVPRRFLLAKPVRGGMLVPDSQGINFTQVQLAFEDSSVSNSVNSSQGHAP
ncbi:hypothetical protein OC842_005858 [Tilletia horrida]|uniref:Uncharacterized protein n=1 Tax=Tilletia horrida TaxID=155126 RepID=A0AAN6JIL0_9BASI|nr:hypothetical protein OC842_005858 [Tilletia horrida]